MAALGVEQPLVQRRFVAQQQESFRLRIQPPDRVDLARELELVQRPVWRTIWRKLRKHAKRFVEGDEHDQDKMLNAALKERPQFGG